MPIYPTGHNNRQRKGQSRQSLRLISEGWLPRKRFLPQCLRRQTDHTRNEAKNDDHSSCHHPLSIAAGYAAIPVGSWFIYIRPCFHAVKSIQLRQVLSQGSFWISLHPESQINPNLQLLPQIRSMRSRIMTSALNTLESTRKTKRNNDCRMPLRLPEITSRKYASIAFSHARRCCRIYKEPAIKALKCNQVHSRCHS